MIRDALDRSFAQPGADQANHIRHGRRMAFVCGLIMLAGMISTASPVWAEEPVCGVERDARTRALDEMSWNQLNRINEQFHAQEYDEARNALGHLLQRAGRDDYLRAIVLQLMAQVDWTTSQYASALSYFEQALELDVLPNAAHFSLMYQLAQLYFLQERYADSLGMLEQWFCNAPAEDIGLNAWVLKASIHSHLEDYRSALHSIEKAIAIADDPQEQWYQLKLAAQFALEQYPQAEVTLEEMIGLWPMKKPYWIELSQISFKLKQPEKALAVMALAYRNQLLDTQADILWLSNLYSHEGIPYRAAMVIEQGIIDQVVLSTPEHWQMVADAWYRAEEMDRALAAYEQAGEQSADGIIDLRLAYILVDLERWADALAALNAALEKGGLNESKEAEAFLLRGLAHFHLKNLDRADSDWARASRNAESREAARQWLNHLREVRKQAS